MAAPAGDAPSGMVVEQFGELVVVNYPSEDEVALFLEGSAEVLNCSKAEWLAFRAQLSGNAGGRCAPAASATGESLHELLQTLGVSVR